MTGASTAAANRLGAADGVTIVSGGVPALGRSLTVPPISIAVFEYRLAK